MGVLACLSMLANKTPLPLCTSVLTGFSSRTPELGECVIQEAEERGKKDPARGLGS